MTDNTTLVLDFGFTPQASEFRQQIESIAERSDWILRTVDIDHTGNDGWDELLSNILAAGKCLTL